MSKYKVRVLLYYIEDEENLFKDKFNIGSAEVPANSEKDIEFVQKLITKALENYEDMFYWENDAPKIVDKLNKVLGD